MSVQTKPLWNGRYKIFKSHWALLLISYKKLLNALLLNWKTRKKYDDEEV